MILIRERSPLNYFYPHEFHDGFGFAPRLSTFLSGLAIIKSLGKVWKLYRLAQFCHPETFYFLSLLVISGTLGIMSHLCVCSTTEYLRLTAVITRKKSTV